VCSLHATHANRAERQPQDLIHQWNPATEKIAAEIWQSNTQGSHTQGLPVTIVLCSSLFFVLLYQNGLHVILTRHQQYTSGRRSSMYREDNVVRVRSDSIRLVRKAHEPTAAMLHRMNVAVHR
jgi:hypothetical protein